MVNLFDAVVLFLLLGILGELIVGVFVTARMTIWWLKKHIHEVALDFMTEIENDPEILKLIRDMATKLVPQVGKTMTAAQIRNMAISSIAQIALSKLAGIKPPPPQ